jgi:hypothetical protein
VPSRGATNDAALHKSFNSLPVSTLLPIHILQQVLNDRV